MYTNPNRRAFAFWQRAFLFTLCLFAATSVTAETPAGPCATDVIDQIQSLRTHADGLGFTLFPDSPEGDNSYHYQGIQRYQGPNGVPYLFYSRSANLANEAGGDIGVVKMNRRDRSIDPLRSNRLFPGVNIESTPPGGFGLPSQDGDRLARNLFFDGVTQVETHVGDPEQGTNFATLPQYLHVSAISIHNDILVVPLEDPVDPLDSAGKVLLMDINAPTNPVLLYTLTLDHKAGTASMTKLDDGTFLIAVTGQDGGETIKFYRSNVSDLRSEDLLFSFFYSWDKDELLTGDWPTGINGLTSHQNFDLIRQCDDNSLYLAGGRSTNVSPILGNDQIDVYELVVTTDPALVTVSQVIANQRMVCSYASTGDTCNFQAGSGFYVSPANEVMMYAIEFHNDGPFDPFGKKSVRAGEFRHERVYNDPALNPDRAWVELYDDDSFGDRSVMFDFRDREKETWINFNDLEGFNDKATSVRWSLPPGCVARLYSNDTFGGDFCTLEGSGEISKFDDAPGDAAGGSCQLQGQNMGDEISSIQFVSFPLPWSCYTDEPTPVAGGPYMVEEGSNLTLRGWFDPLESFPPQSSAWDLDGDGAFETDGNEPMFSAGSIDGPTTRSVEFQTCDGIDRCATEAGVVTIVNVPPDVSFTPEEFGIGQVRLTLKTNDPLDTHVAMIDWGDGTAIQEVAFSDEVGPISHTYALPGDYAIRADVTDDDGGMGDNTKTIEIQDVDSDGDTQPNSSDNCQLVANPEQGDTDGDGFGNFCDPDFNNDCTVNFIDYAQLATQFLSTNAPLYDLNEDGVVNFLDISIFTGYFLMPPGPSGTANVCGTL